MKDFASLKVWQKAHQLVLSIYRISNTFPKSETYGLTSQLRKAVVSIPANIAEGCGRGSDIDFARFLQISMGSAYECEYYFILGHDLGILTKEQLDSLKADVQEVKRMLTSFLKTLRAES